MLIPRCLSDHIRKLCTYFPAVSVTGPRQSGKTTLLKELFPDYKYVSFENPKVRAFALESPDDFLKTYGDKVIFDEAQRFPDLFSYLQGMIDEDRRPGRFILSGSQNFLLRKNITQTLAGRVGISRLLPLDNAELKSADILAETYEEAILQGGYPGRIDQNIEPELFYSSYLSSYVERDVNEFISATNLDIFQRFLTFCAVNTAQTINLAKLSRAVGISAPTAKSWLGILEQSYVIFRLPPFFRNHNKRLAKSAKLYFYDVGLVSYLLGLYDTADVSSYTNRGALFENMIVADAYKSFYHQGYDPRFYFYRDQKKNEIDLLYEKANLTRMWEIKASAKFRPQQLDTLNRIAATWDRQTETNLIYSGDDERFVGKAMLRNWQNLTWER